MINPDGTATCDRCGILLPGYGVLHGLIATHLLNGEFVDTIYCYESGCRDVMLNAAVAFPEHNPTTPGCTFCADPLPRWSPVFALVAREMAEDGQDRPLAFCQVKGHDVMILNRAGDP